MVPTLGTTVSGRIGVNVRKSYWWLEILPPWLEIHLPWLETHPPWLEIQPPWWMEILPPWLEIYPPRLEIHTPWLEIQPPRLDIHPSNLSKINYVRPILEYLKKFITK